MAAYVLYLNSYSLCIILVVHQQTQFVQYAERCNCTLLSQQLSKLQQQLYSQGKCMCMHIARCSQTTFYCTSILYTHANITWPLYPKDIRKMSGNVRLCAHAIQNCSLARSLTFNKHTCITQTHTDTHTYGQTHTYPAQTQAWTHTHTHAHTHLHIHVIIIHIHLSACGSLHDRLVPNMLLELPSYMQYAMCWSNTLDF